jgi:hypothetical protein
MTAEHMHMAVGSGSDRAPADEEYQLVSGSIEEEEEDGVGTGLDLAHLQQPTADPWDEVYRVANGGPGDEHYRFSFTLGKLLLWVKSLAPPDLTDTPLLRCPQTSILTSSDTNLVVDTPTSSLTLCIILC